MPTAQKLIGVMDTLYIPLYARIYVSKHFPSFFYDTKALSLESSIPNSMIQKQSNEYVCMASACRQYVLDHKIRHFLSSFPNGNVVFLGAGLETAYSRLSNTTASFYQVDLPEVIQIRQDLLGCGINEHLIAEDMFTLQWTQSIQREQPTLLVLSGVLQYFQEDKIVSFMRQLKISFPKGELIFDATNHQGLVYANRYVKKTGNTDALMYFSLDDPQSFCKKCSVRLVNVSGFYTEALKLGNQLKLSTRLLMYFADRWKRTLVVHIQLNN